jgi:hypothetical protein
VSFLVELLIQLVVQVLVEIVGEWLLRTSTQGSVRVARSRPGRLTVGFVAGAAFGVAWGTHLQGAQTWPRLLWVSLVLAAVSAVLAVGRAGSPDWTEAERFPQEGRSFGGLLAEAALPPWHWGAERLAGFALINLGIAAGIVAIQAPVRLF